MAKMNWDRQYLRQQRIKRGQETAVYTDGTQPKRATKKQRNFLKDLGFARYNDPFLTLTVAHEMINQLLAAKEKAKASKP
jgi:nitrate reductase beta subunit